ncbi:MAG: hypothetical protein ABL933_06455 [Methyloglobulus sp.]|nr:hypothetical protein [Methyloglobulus sp.]
MPGIAAALWGGQLPRLGLLGALSGNSIYIRFLIRSATRSASASALAAIGRMIIGDKSTANIKR